MESLKYIVLGIIVSFSIGSIINVYIQSRKRYKMFKNRDILTDSVINQMDEILVKMEIEREESEK